jgi:signal transduction histidine kinase
VGDALRLLIVDDQDIQRRVLRAQLEAEGHTVLEAEDGVAALQVLEREEVNAVISDILMPNMDGYRLCREVRKSEKFGALALILYTSTYDSGADRQLAQSIDADGYLVKPAPTPVILDALREAMQKAARRNRAPLPADDAQVLHQYSQVLVHKLEERNVQLQEALEKVRRAHEEILELNRDLERRVAQRTAELQAANQELESFSYSVSHDLHAPLRHIGGYSAMLLQEIEGQLSANGMRYLEAITAASGRMGELIENLLRFSRAGRTEMRKGAVDLNALIQTCIRELEMATQGRDVAWRVAPLPAATGDHAMLSQVFANLLGNAVKYTSPRDAAVIEIGSAGEDNGQLILFVRDNGVGFDMQYADKLFEVFQRLHRADEFEGSGIGLASVHRIIARHGGRIWAEGRPGEGATFYFTLGPSELAYGP